MSGANPLDSVARHIVETSYDDLPPAAVEKVKTFLLDTLGVGIAGSSGASVAALKVVARSWGAAPEASVLLTGERMSAQSAAVMNAYQIHCLEYDCVHEGAVLHPMATILSAVMAWLERSAGRGKLVDGRELITALAVGVDVSTMLGIVTDAPLRFFRPATAGGFGAAAAISKLAQFDIERVKNALGCQYAQTCGTLQPHVEGSPMLGLQVGFNARAAIAATDLAEAGLRGPHDILVGPYGYFALFEQNDHDIEAFLPSLGVDWQILHMSHKPSPSGRLTHSAIDALGKLTEGISPDDIAHIHCRVPPLVHRLVGRPNLPDPVANYAKLCLAFVAGVALARGRVDVPDFRGEALRDPDVHRYAALVEVEQDDNPDLNALDPQTFTVTLKNGETRSIVVERAYGHPEAPLSREANIEKFRRCVGFGSEALPAAQVDAIIASVDALEESDDVTSLIRLCIR